MISSAASCLSSVSDQSAAALYKLINLFIVNPYMSTVAFADIMYFPRFMCRNT